MRSFAGDEAACWAAAAWIWVKSCWDGVGRVGAEGRGREIGAKSSRSCSEGSDSRSESETSSMRAC